MRINLNVTSNIAFTTACAIVALLAGLQIRDRLTTPSAPPAAAAIADITPVDLPIANVPVAGDARAKAAIVEFSDFQCPFCARYVQETYAQLAREFVASGQVRYAFVNAPLPNHQFAKGAAAAAACAHAQGRFWPMHDRLFANQQSLGPADLAGHAKEVGLDARAFETCLGERGDTLVDDDLRLAERLGVRGTPTFLIGTVNPDGTVRVTKKILGARPLSVFREALRGAIGG